jgi:hypothetical protein
MGCRCQFAELLLPIRLAQGCATHSHHLSVPVAEHWLTVCNNNRTTQEAQNITHRMVAGQNTTSQQSQPCFVEHI